MKKVLIVGLGSIGKKHLNAANELKCKVDVISKHAKISENFQLVDNLKNKRVYDLGIICSNTSNHLNDLLRTSKYCKTILVEKPLNHIYIPTQLKIKLEKLKPLVVLGLNLRYLDLMIFLKTYLTDKKIISVENIFWDDCRKWYEGRDFKKLYVSNKHLGGGALLTNIHELDYIKFICNADINHINITYQKNKDNLDKSCMVKGMLDREISFKSSLTFSTPTPLLFSKVRPLSPAGILGRIAIKRRRVNQLRGDRTWYNQRFNLSKSNNNLPGNSFLIPLAVI